MTTPRRPTLRHLVSINDLSDEEIGRIFDLAQHYLDKLHDPDFDHRIASGLDIGNGRILASLFFEPSTRTRLSFESSMSRLNGKVITSADSNTSSAAKGESLADTIRVCSNYADIIVLRHPRDGAARYAADYSSVPIINGGDGSHEHPTQTLCDLFTLRQENKDIANLSIAISGDLRRSRTVHSLVYALVRFGASIILQPAKGMELPPYLVKRLRSEFRCRIDRVEEDEIDTLIDAYYVTPEQPHQPALFADRADEQWHLANLKRKKIDSVYVTRFQKERHDDADSAAAYPVINKRFMQDDRYSKTSILHPLPRVGELDTDLDADNRAAYFRQAAYGVPVRMALIALLLGLEKDYRLERFEGGYQHGAHPVVEQPRGSGATCANRNCIVHDEGEARHIADKFQWISGEEPVLRCHYCETDVPAFVAADKRHKRTYANPPGKAHPENLIFFADHDQAVAAGYQLSGKG